MRVQAEAPFALRAPFLAGEGEVLCHTRLAEGRLRQLAGDTLSLELVGRLISVPGPDRVERVCPANGTVWMVRTAATSVEVSEADTGRTVVVLLVAAVIVLGFAAFAASQIPVGAPSL